jgi:hypothetical protein
MYHIAGSTPSPWAEVAFVCYSILDIIRCILYNYSTLCVDYCSFAARLFGYPVFFEHPLLRIVELTSSVYSDTQALDQLNDLKSVSERNLESFSSRLYPDLANRLQGALDLLLQEADANQGIDSVSRVWRLSKYLEIVALAMSYWPRSCRDFQHETCMRWLIMS